MTGDIRVGRAQKSYPDVAEIYVGRANGRYRLKASPLANPFKLKDYSRDEMIPRYEAWLAARIDEADPAVLADLARQRPVVLNLNSPFAA